MDSIMIILENYDINYLSFNKKLKLKDRCKELQDKSLNDIFTNVSQLKHKIDNWGKLKCDSINLKTSNKRINCKITKLKRDLFIMTFPKTSGVDRKLIHDILNLLQSNLCFIELSLMEDNLPNEVKNNLEISLTSGRKLLSLLELI